MTHRASPLPPVPGCAAPELSDLPGARLRAPPRGISWRPWPFRTYPVRECPWLSVFSGTAWVARRRCLAATCADRAPSASTGTGASACGRGVSPRDTGGCDGDRAELLAAVGARRGDRRL